MFERHFKMIAWGWLWMLCFGGGDMGGGITELALTENPLI